MKKQMATEAFQLFVILAVCVVGEILHAVIPIPISAGVYGMFILFILLCCKVIKLPQVEKVGDFLTNKMLVMFIPAAVGLINVVAELRQLAIPVILCFSVVTIITMVVTGHVVQIISKLNSRITEKKRKKENKDV